MQGVRQAPLIPPYSPTPEATGDVLPDYEDAALVEFVGLPKETTVDPRHIHRYLWDVSSPN